MEKINDLKDKLKEFWEKIQESETFQDIKSRYDELSAQQKLYISLSIWGLVVFSVIFSVVGGIAHVSGIKSTLKEKEDLITYLQESADKIKQLRAVADQESMSAMDQEASFTQFAENILSVANIDRSRAVVEGERDGKEEKTSKEVLLDISLSEVNLRQIVRYMQQLTDQGKKRGLTVRSLNIDTKGDPRGYMDVKMTIASYKAK